MKPLLLHGPAINASRKKLQEIKNKFNSENIIVFEEKSDLQQILTNLQSQSLFEGERLIVLENPPEEMVSNLPPVLPAMASVAWFDHEIDIKKWPGFEIFFFPEAKEISIFPFLDFLATKDKKAFLELEKLKNAGFDIYYFLTMIIYLLRNLIATPKNAPQFVRDKLNKQRKNISKENITELYKNILEIDFKIKSGLLDKPQAEFYLINMFL